MTILDENVDILPQRLASDAAPAEPLWLLRVNPLRRSRLSDELLRGLLARLAEAERAVRSAAGQCSEQIYRLIGSTVNEADRRRLIELRRSIHNERVPKGALPRIPSVSLWYAAHERRRTLREEVVQTYAAAAERERGTLAMLLGDEHLRCSLALIAPEVYKESERYSAAVADVKPLSARARKSERGLIQYVTRAMVRTSPLSQFTAVGIAVPDRDGVDPAEVRFEQAAVFPGLDRVMLAYVIGGLHPPVGAGLMDAWVGLSPTSALDSDAGKLYVLRSTDAGFQRSAVAVTGPIQLLLDATAMGPRSVRAVVSHIATRSGCSTTDGANLVAGAVRNGILCSFNEAEDGSADLTAMLSPPDSNATGALEEVKAGLSKLETASAADRGEELSALGNNLAKLSRLAQRPAQIMVEEDYILPPMKVATAHWRKPLTELSAAVELLSVFDWLHDVRVMTTAAFVQRFGAGANVPLSEHAEDLVEEVSRRAVLAGELAASADGTGALTGIGTDDGCLEQLYALRRRVIDATGADIAKAVEANRPEVLLSAEDAVALTAGMPERFRRDPLSYGVLAQWSGDRLIFNDGLPGHGMLYSRFLDADRRLGGDGLHHLTERLVERYGWDGSRVVEDLGLYRLNVNAHPRILPDGLGPDDWFSLRLVHDRESDTLSIEDADGRKLRVLPLGTGHPGLFPPPLSVASCLATGGRLNNYLLDLWHTAAPWDNRHTRVAPRISVGDVVVARRRWYGGAELATAMTAGPDEHDRLLALTAWRSRHDVPEEVVIKTTFEEESPRSLKASDVLPRRQKHKPQYVDLTCALSTRVLPRMLDRRAEVHAVDYLEEALPAVVEGTNAFEWVVEIGRRPAGLFQYEGEIG